MIDVERPDIREQVGTALNTSSMVNRPLELVGALGAATLAVRLGVNRDRVPVIGSAPAIERRTDARRATDRLGADLGALLWHVRYARQHSEVPRATTLFAEWMMDRPTFAKIEPDSARRLMLDPFAVLAVHEWLSDKCIACGGCGKEEKLRDGSVVRPRATMQRNARYAVCRGCGGNGRAQANHKQRARHFGIPLKWYFEQTWPARFISAYTWLTQLGGRLSHPLTTQLERRRKLIY